MRKLLLAVVAFMASSLIGWADGLNVVSFKLLETDLTANTRGTQKQDQNGEKAALIKIVSPEQGFLFNGGSLGIVATENKPGEIWLYVPPRAQKLTITHQSFGVLRDYYYAIPIRGGRTYEMLLDIGTGRYVTITTSQAKSDLTIDGEYVGKAPIYNRYMSYGKHTISAQNGRYEGVNTFSVVPTDDSKGRVVSVEMRDMSDHFGDVEVTVDNNAEIIYNGRNVGTGSWKTQLREGSYTIETHKVDCNPATTTFTVVAQKKNEVKANAPTPFTGYLNVFTRPTNVAITYNGNKPIEFHEAVTLPIGTYQLEFTRKGYVTQNHEFTVSHNQLTTDTVTLERIKYVKPLAFYFGAAYSLRSLSGATGILGAVIKGHDIQLHYTFGLTASNPIHCYKGEGSDDYQSTISYKQSSFGIKYGYQVNLMDKLAITPQIGVCVDRLSGTLESGTNLYADGASATCVSIGAKLLYAPTQHFYLFAAPEFDVAVQKDDNFKQLADASNITAGGFVAHLGLIVNF